MIEIKAIISKLPDSKERYRLIADTEGSLEIAHDNAVVFAQDNVLLVEFARVLGDWLLAQSKDQFSEFVYCSMDFEEEPVLAFRISDDTNLTLESALLDDSRPFVFLRNDMIVAARLFLTRLAAELVDLGINLEEFESFSLS